MRTWLLTAALLAASLWLLPAEAQAHGRRRHVATYVAPPVVTHYVPATTHYVPVTTHYAPVTTYVPVTTYSVPACPPPVVVRQRIIFRR